ncbi:hypothetical protein [Parageobacillus thermoglucosidasius]|nr:hypothetical protein [Parageobacillus thermoglucosidasius]
MKEARVVETFFPDQKPKVQYDPYSGAESVTMVVGGKQPSSVICDER